MDDKKNSDTNLGGDWARDDYEKGYGGDYAREDHTQPAGARGDFYGSESDAKDEKSEVPPNDHSVIGKASE